MRWKQLRDDPPTFLLVFEKGDQVLDPLTSFARERNLRAGNFHGIGALREVTFAYWNSDAREYEHIGLHEQVEVISLIGNVSAGDDGEPKIHGHISIGRRDGRMVGGHLIEGRVYPTLEIFLVDYGGVLQRRRDSETKLPLLSLE